jgi:excisionase family DNA binding protein
MPVHEKSTKFPRKTRGFEAVSTPASTGSAVERHFRMKEAAHILGVSRPTLYRWLPRIRHRRIPAGGLTKEIVLIPESALAEFLACYDRIPEAKLGTQA